MTRPEWNLLTGTLTRYVLLFVNIAIGVFLMPFTMHHLGKAQYGLWMLAASLTAYLQLLDLGYGNGLVRQVTQADARGDEEEMNRILSTFLVVYSVIGTIALGAVAALAALVPPRFPNLSPADVATARTVLLLLGIRVAIAFPMSVFGAVTTARQRFALTGWIAIAIALLQGAASVSGAARRLRSGSPRRSLHGHQHRQLCGVRRGWHEPRFQRCGCRRGASARFQYAR